VNKALINDDFVAPKCDQFLEILYQDDDILLSDKPSGLLSLSGKNPLNWDSVHYRLVNGQQGTTPSFPLAKLPHRLDFGTSGLMVVALHPQAAKYLNKQFQERRVKKRYIAMLAGELVDDSGEISAPIAKDPSIFPRVKICSSTGKAALSEYRVLERLSEPARTLVSYLPHTGRTHQLRIHSLAIGHPIIGCDLYSNSDSQTLAQRLQLHASDLYFEHPATGKMIHFHSPCPFA
jgi:tRNA pseudouridine32 synthase/23S rRNA pseudouridine746 synthase